MIDWYQHFSSFPSFFRSMTIDLEEKYSLIDWWVSVLFFFFSSPRSFKSNSGQSLVAHWYVEPSRRKKELVGTSSSVVSRSRTINIVRTCTFSHFTEVRDHVMNKSNCRWTEWELLIQSVSLVAAVRGQLISIPRYNRMSIQLIFVRDCLVLSLRKGIRQLDLLSVER